MPEDFVQTDHPGPFSRRSQSPEGPPHPFPVASLASKAVDSFGLLFSHVNEITLDIFFSVFFQLSRSVCDTVACHSGPSFSLLWEISGWGHAPKSSISSHLGEHWGSVPFGAMAGRAPRGILSQVCPCTREHVALGMYLKQESPSYRMHVCWILVEIRKF